MTNKYIGIENLALMVTNKYPGMCLGESVAEAFSYLSSPDTRINSYSSPMHIMESAIHWSWMNWHLTKNATLLERPIHEVVGRVSEINKLAGNQGLRRLHDIFMVQAAILSGSRDTMVLASKTVGSYNAVLKIHAYEWGLVGVYKNAILNDEAKMIESRNLMMSSRPSPPYRMPTKAIVNAFVDNDQRSFGQLLKGHWKREWKSLELRDKGIVEKSDEKVVVSLDARTPNNYWPWPEAAFAKLAVLKGWKVPSDPLWCPEDFLNWKTD